MTRIQDIRDSATLDAQPDLSVAARRRILSLPLEPLFVADWDRALMIHYEVEPADLQRVVPFALDHWNGRAFVSLVAFTLRRMRPRFGGALAELLLKPIATHEFLNVRTYVRHGDETGIFFLAEWLSNPLSVALGPGLFGLPYRLGQLCYHHDWARGQVEGTVRDARRNESFEYHAMLESPSFQPCKAGSMDEWLMERYTAFTCVSSSLDWRSTTSPRRRFFRVWHSPWPQTQVEVHVQDRTLLNTNWNFFPNATLVGANFSPGVKNV